MLGGFHAETAHAVSNVAAVKTVQAAALRIEVPRMPLTAVFEDMDRAEIKAQWEIVPRNQVKCICPFSVKQTERMTEIAKFHFC